VIQILVEKVVDCVQEWGERMGAVYAVVNQKGGVGKTTTAVNLAACAALDGRMVLLVDLDAQGNATSGLGIDRLSVSGSVFDVIMAADPTEATQLLSEIVVQTQVPCLFVCPATIDLAAADLSLANAIARELRLRQGLAEARNRYDLIIVDTGPSLGILTINALAAAEAVLVPIQCEYYALEGLSQLLQVIELVKAQLNPGLRMAGAVLTMFDSRTRLSFDVVEEVRRSFPGHVFETMIPRNVRLAEAPSYGVPVVIYDRGCAGAQAYWQLYAEVFVDEEPRTRSGAVGTDIGQQNSDTGGDADTGGPPGAESVPPAGVF
jgi:chromosome partitioning protein